MTAATVGSMARAQNQPESRKSDDDDDFGSSDAESTAKVDFSGDPLDTSKEKNYFDYIFKPQPDLEYNCAYRLRYNRKNFVAHVLIDLYLLAWAVLWVVVQTLCLWD